jgi:hypothetical protein
MGIAAGIGGRAPSRRRKGRAAARQRPSADRVWSFFRLAACLLVLDLTLAGCQIYYSLFPEAMPEPGEDEFYDPSFQAIYQEDEAFRAWYDNYWRLESRYRIDLRRLRIAFHDDFFSDDQRLVLRARQDYRRDFDGYATVANITQRDLAYAPRFRTDQLELRAALSRFESDMEHYLAQLGCRQPLAAGPVSCSAHPDHEIGAGVSLRF